MTLRASWPGSPGPMGFPPGGAPGDAAASDGRGPAMQAALLEMRTVVLSGELDDQRAGEVVAQLMTLDATGDDHVDLHVNSWGHSLQAAFSVMDTIDLLGVPVHVRCLGRAEGPVVGVVAVAAHRQASPHARFRLCQPRFESAGTAHELAEWSLHCQRQLDHFCDRLAEATGRTAGGVADDLAAGRFLSADEAERYGLIDAVGHGRPPGPGAKGPLGFQPNR